MTFPLLPSALLCLSLFFFGCSHPLEDIEESQADLSSLWESSNTSPSSRSLSYPEALVLLRANPIKTAEWEQRLSRAASQTKQPYRNLLPQLRAGLFFSERLSDLGDASWEDLSFDLSGHWLFAGLLHLREDLYLARLNQFQTELLYNESLRQDTILLHELFSSLYNAQHDHRVFQDLLNFTEPFAFRSAQDLRFKIQDALFENEQRQRLLNQQLGSLLGLTHVRWRLPNPPPDLNSTLESTPILPQNFGSLRRQLWAVDLVAAQARARGMNLRKWPQFNLSANSGTLVNLNGNDAPWFDGNQGVLYSRITVPIDLTGNIYRNAREAKEDFTRLRQALIQSQNLLAAELSAIQENCAQLDQQISRESTRLDLLRSLQANQSGSAQVTSIDQAFTQFLRLQTLQLEHDRALRRLWFFHEPSWPSSNLPPAL